MKDTTDNISLFDYTNPKGFQGIDVKSSKVPIQNGFYSPTQKLILSTGMYAPFGRLLNSNGKRLYEDGQLERLLSTVRESVRVEIPRILQEFGKEDFLSNGVYNIVVEPEFPKNGRELEYTVGFLE